MAIINSAVLVVPLPEGGYGAYARGPEKWFYGATRIEAMNRAIEASFNFNKCHTSSRTTRSSKRSSRHGIRTSHITTAAATKA